MQTTKKLSIIVAIAANNAIGKDNKLLWHISEDLKWFKRNTSGHTIIMGKNTYNSLPVKPLPKRRNIVITTATNAQIDGCDVAHSVEDAIRMADEVEENFIIGGAAVYAQFLPVVQKLYITYIDKPFEADTFFPDLPDTEWVKVETFPQTEEHADGLHYEFQIYIRKSAQS